MKRQSAYESFIEKKSQIGKNIGFEPTFLPDYLFDFQKHSTSWAVRKGRALLSADCGLGKTIQEIVWAQNIVEHVNRPVLILAPLAVASQFLKDAGKFGIDLVRCQDGNFGNAKLVVTNYDRIDNFDWKDFGAVVCDEASILKNYSGALRKKLTRFMSKIKYRLLATATAAPNDWVELGTCSEALGELSHSDMLRRFFMQLDDKGQKRELRLQDDAERLIESDPSYYKKLAFRVSQTIGQWRLKHHAKDLFWRWVASWALAYRRPSDLGFSDERYILPSLEEIDHIIEVPPKPGYLFNMPAVGMYDERQERKRTINQRCEFAADLVKHNDPAVVWCHTNDEADLLEKLIPGAVQVAGRTPDERKIEIYEAFASGQIKKVVIKPKIGAWGLNWQHCNHTVTFATHSWEQHYQQVRRFWRFGQERPVRVDVIATDGEVRVLKNMRSKAKKADEMFTQLVGAMNNSLSVERNNKYTKELKVPSWV